MVSAQSVSTRKHNRVRGQVAPHSSGREIIELAPLISARAVYHAREFVGVSGFCRRAEFVTARAIWGVRLFLLSNALCFAFIVRCAFWFPALVIEALPQTPQACWREA